MSTIPGHTSETAIEAAERKIEELSGVILRRSPFYFDKVVDESARIGYQLRLTGPYHLRRNPDLRLFIWHRVVEDSWTITYTAMDTDDDSVLIQGFDGGEEYRSLAEHASTVIWMKA